MKRKLSESDTQQQRSTSRLKRCKGGADVDAPHTSPPQSNTSSRTPALTAEALYLLQQSFVKDKTKSDFADSNSEEMTTPPTPRSAPSQFRGRTRRPARSLRSRTPSPTKNPTPQTYRTRNLYHAGVYIETLADLPPAIDKVVRQILEIDSWDNQPMALKQHLKDIADWYQNESQRNTQNVSLEGDWKFSLFGLVRKLSDPLSANLKAHMSEKGKLYITGICADMLTVGLVWNTDLKPMGLLPDNNQDEEMRTLYLTQPALPTISPDDIATEAVGFSMPVPYLPPSSDSAAPTTSTQAADPYYISTPKPDITVGLAHTGFSALHQHRLVDHQASGSILSDPHTADMGIRFPFLVAETKGSSANGTLISAQNQAAVCGASMLLINRDLNNQTVWYTSSASDFRPSLQEESLPLSFSIVTAGPTHEVNVHFMHEGAFHMYCVRACRTSHRRDTQELVHFLDRILEWGIRGYKSGIVEKLDTVPRCE
jgi:hypothetical protein